MNTHELIGCIMIFLIYSRLLQIFLPNRPLVLYASVNVYMFVLLCVYVIIVITSVKTFFEIILNKVNRTVSVGQQIINETLFIEHSTFRIMLTR